MMGSCVGAGWGFEPFRAEVEADVAPGGRVGDDAAFDGPDRQTIDKCSTL